MFLPLKIDFTKIESWFGPVLVFLIAFVIARVLNFLLRRYIRRSARVMKVDPTNYSFLQNAVSLIVLMGAVFFIFWNIPALHNLGKTLFASAGILAAIVAFASQEALSNIISGVFLVIYKPFSVGDNIKLLSTDQVGVVEDITLRHTILKSIENRRIIIPNSVISREQILNSTIKDERIQFHLEVTITYQSDHRMAMDIMREEAMRHPLFIDGRNGRQKMEGADPLPVKVVGLEPLGVRLRAHVWTKNNDDAFEAKCDLMKILKDRFRESRIEFATDLAALRR